MKKTLFLGLLLLLGVGCGKQNNAPITNPLIPDENAKTFCQGEGILGTKQTENSETYCVVSDDKITFEANAPQNYSFYLVDNIGETLSAIKKNRNATMHVIFVRRDLKEFLHYTPKIDPTTNEFTIENLSFPSEGPYRMIVEFATQKNGIVFSTYKTIVVGDISKYNPTDLKDGIKQATIGSYIITMGSNPDPIVVNQQTTLRFSVEKDKKPFSLSAARLLGNLGQLFIVQEYDLTYVPVSDVTISGNALEFTATFPAQGRYKMFFESPLLKDNPPITNTIEVQ